MENIPVQYLSLAILIVNIIQVLISIRGKTNDRRVKKTINSIVVRKQDT
jgi:hypothetical protein